MYERTIRCLHLLGLAVLLALVLLIARPESSRKEVEHIAVDPVAALSLTAEDAPIAGATAPGDEAYTPPASAPESTSAEAQEPEEEPAPEPPTEEELLAHWESLADDPEACQIHVNALKNTVTVYERDEAGAYTVPVRAMVCSVGKKTPLGEYRTINRDEWRPLFGGTYGQYATRIVDHILFHSVPYRKKSGDSLLYEEYNKLGLTVSAGCIRLSAADAKWIYDYCALGTTVILYESEDPGPLGKPEPIYIDPESPNRTWDPTDPNPNNPWLTAESAS